MRGNYVKKSADRNEKWEGLGEWIDRMECGIKRERKNGVAINAACGLSAGPLYIT